MFKEDGYESFAFFHGGIQQLLIQKQKVNNKLILKILSKKF